MELLFESAIEELDHEPIGPGGIQVQVPVQMQAAEDLTSSDCNLLWL